MSEADQNTPPVDPAASPAAGAAPSGLAAEAPKSEPTPAIPANEPPAVSAVEKFMQEQMAKDPKPAEAAAPSEAPAAQEADPKVASPAAEADEEDDSDVAPIEKLERDIAELPEDMAKTRLAKKHRKTVSRLKTVEPLADLGADIITTCKAHNWSPQDYTKWVRLGAKAQAGDAEALKELQAMLAVPAPQQTGRRWGDEDDRWLDQQIASGAIAADVAADMRKRWREATPAAPQAPAPAPQPVQQTPVPPIVRQQMPAAPAGPDQQAVARGQEAIATAFAKHTTGLSEADQARVRDEVVRRLGAHRGAHPDAWGAIAENITASVVTTLKAATAPRQTIKPALRPGTGSNPAPAPKTAQEAFMGKWHR